MECLFAPPIPRRMDILFCMQFVLQQGHVGFIGPVDKHWCPLHGNWDQPGDSPSDPCSDRWVDHKRVAVVVPVGPRAVPGVGFNQACQRQVEPLEQGILGLVEHDDVRGASLRLNVTLERHNLLGDQVPGPNLPVHSLQVMQQGEAHLAIHDDEVARALAVSGSNAAVTVHGLGFSLQSKMAAVAAMASSPKVFPASRAWVTVHANTNVMVPLEYMWCSNVSISQRRRASLASSSSSGSSSQLSSTSLSSSALLSSLLWMMLFRAPLASLHLMDASPTNSSESARRRDVDNLTFECPGGRERVRIGLVAPDVIDCPARLVGVLPPHPLTPSGTFVAPDASFAALTLLWVFFPVAGGLSDALMAPAATSGSFRTAWPGPLRRPSRFELILGFGGDRLADLFPPDIPEPFAVFLGPIPTIFRAIITSFELVGPGAFFLEGWFVVLCGEKVMALLVFTQNP